MTATVQVGSRKQLFIDARFFDRASGVNLRMNPPLQSPEPVLRADKPWEKLGIGGYNTVIREGERHFRLWYGAQMKSGGPSLLCGVRRRGLLAEAGDAPRPVSGQHRQQHRRPAG
jgi:hypothetical protein